MPLDSQLTSVRCRSTLTGTAITGFTPTFAVDLSDDLAYTNGTGAGQCDMAFRFSVNVAGGANTNVDLAPLVNGLGVSQTMAKLKVLSIRSRSTNSTNITVSRPATNGVPFLAAASAAFAPIEPGGRIHVESPGATGLSAVTAGTGDIVNIANSAGAAADVDFYVAGTSV